MNLKKLPLNNLRRNPGRTTLLIVLVALLAFTVFGGSLVISSMRGGLDSLEARLGADIMVAPKTASVKYDLEDVFIEGTPTSFYMDKDNVDVVAAMDGVEQASPQYYLATMKAGCCSMPVQIIGIDPETDFTIQPWIDHSYSNELGQDEVLAGCNISGAPGDTITFFDVDCTIVGKLDETGTKLDNSVFAGPGTMVHLMEAAEAKGFKPKGGNRPSDTISAIAVKVAEGHNIQNVVDDINLHARGMVAVQTKAMTTGVADSVAGMSHVIGGFMAVIWILAALVLVLAFSMVGRHRTREFAALRVIGASRKALSRIVITESLAVSIVGAVAGIVVAAIVFVAFNGALEAALGLPFLMPAAGKIVLFAVLALVITLVAGPAASAFSARKLSKVDIGQSLREE